MLQTKSQYLREFVNNNGWCSPCCKTVAAPPQLITPLPSDFSPVAGEEIARSLSGGSQPMSWDPSPRNLSDSVESARRRRGKEGEGDVASSPLYLSLERASDCDAVL